MTTYSYTARNQVEAMENAFNELTTFAYNDVGRVVTQQNHNGTWVSYTFDDAGRLSQLVNLKSDATTLSSFAYALDDVGNRIGVTEASGDVVTWSYDDAYQLTREQRSGANTYDITYQYDPVGNRLTKEEGGAITTYSFDAANQIETEETAAQRTTYSFDDNGNTSVVNAGGSLTTYSWNIENMCTGIELPDSSLNTFTYDANLVRRSAEDSDGLANFINDGQNVLQETDSGGTTEAAYTLAPEVYGSLLSQRRSGASSFHHYDALGSTNKLTDSGEATEVEYLYKAFGQQSVLSGSHANPFTWVGQLGYYRQPDASDYWVRARIMKPKPGRWSSRDPRSLYLASYLYIRNNPPTQTDPSGLDYVEPGGIGCWNACMQDLTGNTWIKGFLCWVAGRCCPIPASAPVCCPIATACWAGMGIAYGAAAAFCVWYCRGPQEPRCQHNCILPCDHSDCGDCPYLHSCIKCCQTFEDWAVCYSHCQGKKKPGCLPLK